MSDNKELSRAFLEKAQEINHLKEQLAKAIDDAAAMLSTMSVAAAVVGKDAQVSFGPAPAVTREQVHDAAKKLLGMDGGKNALKQIMEQYSARKLSEVPDADLADFYQDLKNTMEIPF